MARCRRLVAGALLVAACGHEDGRDPGDGASVDAGARPRASLDPGSPWPRHEIRGGPGGADGVDLDGDGLLDVVSGWEQSGLVTVSFHPGADRVAEPWPTAAIEPRLPRVEDAVFADVDGDGHLDVIAATETGQIEVLFAPRDGALLFSPASWTRVSIAAATGVQRWIKVAHADVDGDGVGDIVAGGKVSPATVGWLRAPPDPRRADGWVYTPISPVGWTMSLEPRDLDADGDLDLVVSDRRYITDPELAYGLRGSRWLENPGGAAVAGQTPWTNHPIGHAPGDAGFLAVADMDGDGALDVVDGSTAAAGDTLTIRRNLGAWRAWEGRDVPAPSGVGRLQALAAGDVDLDGAPDLVLTTSHADAASGLVWLGDAGAAAARGELSGAPGAKFDNVVLVDLDGDGDLDAVTSEQVEGLGVIWYENPLLSRAASGASARPAAPGR